MSLHRVSPVPLPATFVGTSTGHSERASSVWHDRMGEEGGFVRPSHIVALGHGRHSCCLICRVCGRVVSLLMLPPYCGDSAVLALPLAPLDLREALLAGEWTQSHVGFGFVLLSLWLVLGFGGGRGSLGTV